MVRRNNLDNAERNNLKENKKRIQHEYAVGDLVLIVKKNYERRTSAKISAPTELEGPYKVLEIYKNGNVKIQRGKYTDVISMRRITPYTKR